MTPMTTVVATPIAEFEQVLLKEGVVAYHGIPLVDKNEQLFGTLCHFDFEPRRLPDEEFEFLHQAARVLSAYL
jgi:GAF domain-containing protein